MRKLLLLVNLIFSFIFLAGAQEIHPVLNKELQIQMSGMSAERLSRIDRTVQDYIDKQWLNGAIAIVYRNGKLAYYKGFGYDDPDIKTKMPKDGIFRIASQTKAVVSTAIMILYENGKLLLGPLRQSKEKA